MRQAGDVWTDAERQEFVDHIARNPDAGDVIPATGGVRKLRWRRQGMGKRGGVRVICFHHNPATPLFPLMVYAKAMREDVTPKRSKHWLNSRHPSSVPFVDEQEGRNEQVQS